MEQNLLYPEDIDRNFSWALGTAGRLARRGQLPHYLLPDGSIRMRWEEVEALVQRVAVREQSDPRRSSAIVSEVSKGLSH